MHSEMLRKREAYLLHKLLDLEVTYITIGHIPLV